MFNGHSQTKKNEAPPFTKYLQRNKPLGRGEGLNILNIKTDILLYYEYYFVPIMNIMNVL